MPVSGFPYRRVDQWFGTPPAFATTIGRWLREADPMSVTPRLTSYFLSEPRSLDLDFVGSVHTAKLTRKLLEDLATRVCELDLREMVILPNTSQCDIGAEHTPFNNVTSRDNGWLVRCLRHGPSG